jgi:hypothetical protein
MINKKMTNGENGIYRRGDSSDCPSLSQSFYPGGTLEIIFRSQGTPA